MANHVIQETRMLMRLMTIVVRRTRRRDGVQSTQRPRALAKKSTQTVSAMPLQREDCLDAGKLAVLGKDNSHFIDEAVRFPGKEA